MKKIILIFGLLLILTNCSTYVEEAINKDFKPIIAFTKIDECRLFPRELCVLHDKNVKMGFLTGSKTILGSLALSEPDVLASHLESYLTDEFNDE